MAAFTLLAGLGLVSPATSAAATSPIKHVVIIYMENHSFDNVLGQLCVQDSRCVGASTGMTHDGQVIPLKRADDIVPGISHGVVTQRTVINGGSMNGWDLVDGCAPSTGYSCYQQFYPDQIPNIASLARAYALSDHTFEMDPIPTFGAHIELAANQLAGFYGEHPQGAGGGKAGTTGWGCDSARVAEWHTSPTDPLIWVPSCIPASDGTGPFQASPVQHVPTIMDRIDEAGLSWKIYAPQAAEQGYIWATCPMFANCIYGPQKSNFLPYQQFATEAATTTLPTLSIVLPDMPVSTHNHMSMTDGDNWIGQQVGAIMNGPNWDSTAVFITFDDCGCFYDHMTPPPGLGIRVPMLIVSPYAKAAYTDAGVASYASMNAFVEHTFGLPPLWWTDATAYDYANAFDYSQAPRRAAVEFVKRPVPQWERRYIAAHPPDPNDPT